MTRVPLLGLAAALLAASAIRAASPAAPPCPAIDPPAPAAARLRVFVDPVTGALREPTADELRTLAEARRVARETAPPPVFVVVEHPNGMKSVDLGDAFLFDVKLETLPDGSPKITCVPRSGQTANPAQ